MGIALKGVFRKTRHKGASIVESLILIVILALTIGAVFATMALAHRNHFHSRQYRESRELLFNFVQVFDAMFRPDDIDLLAPALVDLADDAFEQTVIMMAGTPTGFRTAQIRGFAVEVNPVPTVNQDERTLALGISINSGGRTWVDMQGNNARRFNATINKTVQDWSGPDA